MSVPNDVAVEHGYVYVGPTTESWPALTATPSGNWLSVGHFDEDGITFESDEEVTVVKSGQAVYPIKTKLRGREVKVSVNLIESSLQNLAHAFGDTSGDVTASTDYETYKPTLNHQERSLYIYFPTGANNGLRRNIKIRRAVALGAISIPMGDAGAHTVPVQFLTLKASTETDSVIFEDES